MQDSFLKCYLLKKIHAKFFKVYCFLICCVFNAICVFRILSNLQVNYDVYEHINQQEVGIFILEMQINL